MVDEKISQIADHPYPRVRGKVQNSMPNLSPLVSTGKHQKGVGPAHLPHANAAWKGHTWEGQKNPELLSLRDLGESAQQPDQSSRTLPTSDERDHMEDSSKAGVRSGEAATPGSLAPPVMQAVKLNVPNSESGMAKQHLLVM
ncbi:hypothetical protein NDU88_006202 [Pleurodeles waltl]|uniref:Uncharacterized protein n=1 Tax=Pleurodeles waltl TaxID=8319 RepID=A0AAV7PKS7_PLEWA|nr:hypothetical protein NDU88_006202 [Pleurodeles waltl]